VAHRRAINIVIDASDCPSGLMCQRVQFNIVPHDRLDRLPTEQGYDVAPDPATVGDQHRFRLGCRAELSRAG
jgi:hypothetical protein